jgi:hypothetical protein
VELKIDFPTLTQWVQDAMQGHWHFRIAMEDLDVDALNLPPSTKVLRYQRLKAYIVITSK